MSTKIAMEFGEQYGSEYARVLVKWGKKLKGVESITDDLRKEWGKDLRKALEADIVTVLVEKEAPQWKKAGNLPSEDTLRRFAQTAAKISLEQDMNDLLNRLREIAQRSLPEGETIEDALNELTAAGFLIGQIIKRSQQTTAQILDMVADKFSGIMNRFFNTQGRLTGRRRWRVTATNSRHNSLNGQIKSDGESFEYKGQLVYGPRPPGGSPENWSNCSCSLQFETRGGDWVSRS